MSIKIPGSLRLVNYQAVPNFKILQHLFFEAELIYRSNHPKIDIPNQNLKLFNKVMTVESLDRPLWSVQF